MNRGLGNASAVCGLCARSRGGKGACTSSVCSARYPYQMGFRQPFFNFTGSTQGPVKLQIINLVMLGSLEL